MKTGTKLKLNMSTAQALYRGTQPAGGIRKAWVGDANEQKELFPDFPNSLKQGTTFFLSFYGPFPWLSW